MPSYPTFNWNPLDLADALEASGHEPRRVRDRGARRRAARVRLRGPGRPGELAAGADRAGGRTCSAPRRKGDEYFLRHLIGAVATRCAPSEAPEAPRPRDVRLARRRTRRQARPAADAGLPDDLHHAVLRRRPARRDLVREVRPVQHRHAPVRARVQPRDPAAVADPHRLRRLPHPGAARSRELAADALGVRSDLVAVPLLHDTPDELATPGGDGRGTGATTASDAVPGVNFPKLVVVERDYPAVAAKLAALGPLADTLGATTKGVTFDLDPSRWPTSAARTGVVRGGAADGRPPAGPRRARVRGDPGPVRAPRTASSPSRVSATLERRTGTQLADLAAEHEGKQITFADTQARPTPVITSPEWSGSETGGRRYSAFVDQRRAVQALAHPHRAACTSSSTTTGWPSWASSCRSTGRRWTCTGLFGEPRDRRERRARRRGALPDAALEVVDPLRVPGQPVHALAVARRPDDLDDARGDAQTGSGSRDNDWIEAVNRNGVDRGPRDRVAPDARRAPCTCTTRRSGSSTSRSPRPAASAAASTTRGTRLLIKPSHLIGGYAQLSYAFNYLGPTGNQRDEVTVIRRRARRWTY